MTLKLKETYVNCLSFFWRAHLLRGRISKVSGRKLCYANARARVGVTRNCRLKDFDPKTRGTATGKHNGAPQRGTTVANKKKLINLKRKQKYRIQFIKYSCQYIQFFLVNDFSSRILSTFCLKILTDSFSIYITKKEI